MSLKKLASLPPQPDKVWCAAPHPTIPLLATAAADKTVRLYSLRTFQPHSTIEGGHKRSIRSVSWKPHTKHELILATASFDSTTGIWHRDLRSSEDTTGTREEKDARETEIKEDDEEEEEWRFAVVLDGHDSEVKSVAWSSGGSFLATCSRDKSVWIWEEMDEDNFETIAVLQEHSQDVKMVVWHPEEELLASCSYDDTIRFYKEDIDDWICCAVLTGHTSTVWAISFENNGSESRLVSGSDDLTARIWHRKLKAPPSEDSNINATPSIIKRSNDEVQDWEEECVLPSVHERTIYSVDWSKKSGLIATAGGDGKVVVYKEEKEKKGEWKVAAVIEGAHGVFEVNSVTWCRRWDSGRRSEDEEVLISTGDDGAVNIWELHL